MIIKINRTEEYVPTFNGNDKEAKPVVFIIKHLTTAEYQDCDKYEKNSRSKFKDVVRLFETSVIEIKNLEVDIDGKKQKIKTSEEFLEVPLLSALYDEVAAHIIISVNATSFNSEKSVKN